jgi:hypothetical protein
LLPLLLLLLLLQLPEGVKDLDGAALLQHASKVQSAVMMAVNEHNTVAHAVSALMWQLLNCAAAQQHCEQLGAPTWMSKCCTLACWSSPES